MRTVAFTRVKHVLIITGNKQLKAPEASALCSVNVMKYTHQKGVVFGLTINSEKMRPKEFSIEVGRIFRSIRDEVLDSAITAEHFR